MPDFGLWSPDKPPFDNDGLITCTNVLPGDTSYLPIPSGVSYTPGSSVDSPAVGAISARDIEQLGVTYNFIGTQGNASLSITSKLFLLDNGTLSDVSNVTPYTTQQDEVWEFAQFGNAIIATNFDDNLQVYSLESTSTVFTDLGGSPPKARHIARVGDFVVLGNLNDTVDGFKPQRIQWSGITSIATWTVSATDQSDFNDLNNNYGWIQQIVGGEFGGLVFQEFGIIRMTYVGSPLIFQFDEVKGATGLLAPNCAVNIGDGVAYLGQDGFYITDGQTSFSIGEDQVNRFFFDNFDATFVNYTRAFKYPRYNIVAWSFRTSNTSGNYNDKIIFYNYGRNSKKRWSLANINNSAIYQTLTQGYTLEELDDYGSGNQTLETLPYSLDSKAYQGNEQVVGIIDENNELVIFTGTPLTATLEAGELQPFEGKTGTVTRFRPLLDAPLSNGNASLSTTPSVSMRVGYRNILTENVSYIFSFTPTTATGSIPARVTGRYFRFEMQVSGEFNSISGYEIESAVRRGRR